MGKVKKEENVRFIGSSELLATDISSVKCLFECDLTGSKSPQPGALGTGMKLENIPLKLTCTGTTLMDAMKFACGGQSYRVAIQSRLRRMPKHDLEKAIKDNKNIEFFLSDLINPSRTHTKAPPKVVALRECGKMTKEERREFMAALEAMDKEENSEE
jgi:hypothetical protein